MGPVASVLLRDVLTARQVDELARWLGALGSAGSSGCNEWEVLISNYQALGLDERTASSPCVFWVDLVDPPHIDDPWLEGLLGEEQQQIRDLLGFAVAQRITLSAGCGKPADHLILASLAVQLATIHGGMISMAGEVTLYKNPPERYSHRGRAVEHGESDEGLRERTRRSLQGLPGRMFESLIWLEVGASTPRKGIRHIFDPRMLDAWTRHPDFHMLG